MTRNNVIKKQDYEHYIVPLPVKQLFTGNTNKYIYGQLENLHPCFSSDWYFSSRIKIKKTGLFSDVLVINKLKLTDYKKGFVHFENYSGGRIIFSNKQKIQAACLVTLIVVLISSSLFFINYLKMQKKSHEKTENIETLEITDDGLLEKNERKELIGSFFNQMEKSGGKIDYIEWFSDGYKEKIFIKVNGVFPKNEGITKKITYRNGIPEFMVELNDFCKTGKQLNRKITTQFCEKLRNLLISYGIKPNSENLENYKISFTCENYSENKGANFFIELNDLCKKENLGITKINIQKNKKTEEIDGFTGEISINPLMEFCSGINLEPFGWRTNLMFEKKHHVFEEPKIVNTETFVNNFDSNKGIKLGEVIHADGSRRIYYKNNEGKVIWTN